MVPVLQDDGLTLFGKAKENNEASFFHLYIIFIITYIHAFYVKKNLKVKL